MLTLMYMCVQSNTEVHTYTNMDTFIHHTYMHVHTHIYACTHASTHTYAQVFLRLTLPICYQRTIRFFFYVPTGVEQSLISALAFGIYFAAHLFLKPNSTFHKEGRKASEAVVSHGFDLSPNCICGFLQLSLHVKINLHHMPSPGEY